MSFNHVWNRRAVLAAMATTAARPRMTQAAPLGTPAPLRAYSSLPAYEHVCLSPGGQRVAFVSDTNDGRAVCDQDLAADTIAAKGIGKDPVTFLMWADDTNILVITSPGRPVGPFRTKLTLGGVINVSTRKMMQIRLSGLIHPHQTNNYQRVTIDGKNRLTVPDYDHGDTQSRVTGAALTSYSLTSGRMFDMDVDGQPIQNWVVRPDGNVVARSEYDDRTGIWKVRYKTEKGWQEIFQVTADLDLPSLRGLGRDGTSLLVKFNGGENGDHYIEINPDGSLNAPISDAGDDHFPLFNHRTGALAGFASTPPVEACIFYDPQMKNLPALLAKALPGTRNYLVDYGEEPRKVVVYSEGDDDAGTYYYIDFLTGASIQIGAPYPELTPSNVGKQSQFTYKARDGLDITAYLTLPPANTRTRLPVVVLPHGGLGDYTEEGFDWLPQAIASRGYAVVQPNYRGSGGHGHEQRFAGHGEIGGRALNDLSDAVSFLAGQGIVDADRAAIVGRDFSGYMALAGVTVMPGNYRCAASIGGISDVDAFLDYIRQDFGFDDNAPGLLYIRRYFGDKTRWNAVSPINHAASATCPILLIHGQYDAFILPSQSAEMNEALAKAGKTSTYIQLKKEDSSLYGGATRLQAVESLMAFLNQHNPVG